MTARRAYPLTRAQVAQLGGFARAQKRTKDEIAMWGARGGETVVERYGKGHLVRLAHISHGRLTKKASATNAGPNTDR